MAAATRLPTAIPHIISSQFSLMFGIVFTNSRVGQAKNRRIPQREVGEIGNILSPRGGSVAPAIMLCDRR